MTVKQFFKSTSFKCIAALLSILLVCGVFLTIMYGLLEVTEGERLQRAIKKLYGGTEVTIYGMDDVKIDDSVKEPKSLVSETVSLEKADILAAYRIELVQDGETHIHYLVQSRGKGGNDNGTVTCWVAVEIKDGKISEIYNISITANTSQEYADGRFNDEFFGKFKGEYNDRVFSTADGYLVSGATQSSNAIDNSVNGAISFIKETFLGEEIETSKPYSMYIDLENTVFDKETGKLTVVTKDKAEGLYPHPFTFEIAVTADKKIESFEIIANGSTSDKNIDKMNPGILDGTLFAGKDLAYFENITANGQYSDNMNEVLSGATQSNFICAYACAFALANIDDYTGGNA